MAGRVLVITGPTATGKTRLGAELARRLGGEVIGADSMQIYQYMDVGTAKPAEAEMLGVPHHMIGVVSPFENYSVSRYVEDAGRIADDILARGRLPVLVGGTNLYIDSLVSGRDFAEEGNASGLRAELAARYDELGGEVMLAELRAFDPETAGRLHPNDKKRIVRAFEVYRATGETLSAHDAETRRRPARYDACTIALTFRDRQDLYDRIDRRVDRMLEDGLVDEVRRLLEMGVDAGCTAMQAIGYKEIAAALRSGGDLAAAAEAVKQNSRRYAKRQLSWLRRDPTVHWIQWEKEPDFGKGLRDSTDFLEKYGIL